MSENEVLDVLLPLPASKPGEQLNPVGPTVHVYIPLLDGMSVVEAQALFNRPADAYLLKAAITVRSWYDKAENKLTIYGNDSSDPDAMTLVLSRQKKDVSEDDGPGVRIGVRGVLPAPGLSEQDFGLVDDETLVGALSQMMRLLNDAIVDSAIAAGVDSVLCVQDPPIIDRDNLQDFKAMYGTRVTENFPEDESAQIALMQSVVNSTFRGTVTWSRKVFFANVIGSTKDPKPKGVTSWLGLWMDKCNSGRSPARCTSYMWSSSGEIVCGSSLVGGHVILGKWAQSVARGRSIYIFPICRQHNGSDPNYMKCIYNQKGIEMRYW